MSVLQSHALRQPPALIRLFVLLLVIITIPLILSAYRLTSLDADWSFYDDGITNGILGISLAAVCRTFAIA